MGMFGAIPGGLSSMPDWMKMSMQGQQPQPMAPQSMGAAPPSPQGMFGAPQSAYGPVKGSLSEKLMAIGGVLSQLGGVRNDNLQQYFATLEGRREDQRKAQLAEAARYAPQEVGGNIVSMQPDGSYKTLYSAPQKAPEAPQIVRLQQIYDDPSTPPSVRATVKAAIDAQTDPVITTPGGGLALRSTVTGSMGGGAPQAYDDLPPGYNIRAPGGAAPAPLTPSGAAPILRGAASSTTITRAQAAQIRASLGPKGQAAFAQWLAAHNVTVGDQ